MPTQTKIEWTGTPRADGTLEPGFTSNPIKFRDPDGKIVWGCVKHSTGCSHCYAETLAKRYGRGGPFSLKVMETLTPYVCETELKAILKSKKIAGKKVFLGDMTDIFGEWVTNDMLNRLFSSCLELRTDVTFQLLTKRAGRMQDYLSWRWGEGRIPCRHIHVGVSVENQAAADERIPHLLQTPAAVRFLSCEPLLGPVDLSRIDHPMSKAFPELRATFNCLTLAVRGEGEVYGRNGSVGVVDTGKVGWVIVGGESGAGARPMDLEWARSIVAQCKAAKVAVFVKQLGAYPTYTTYEGKPSVPVERPWTYRDEQADRCTGPTRPITRAGFADKKGGNIDEFPADLRVRDFPEPTHA